MRARTVVVDGFSAVCHASPAHADGRTLGWSGTAVRPVGRRPWCRARRSLLLAACLATLACGRDGPTPAPGGGAGDPGAPATPPLPVLAPGEWRWFDVLETRCNDGSTTGIAVNRGTTSDVLVVMDGGGACWSQLTCAAGLAKTGPFQFAQFQARQPELRGTFLDREDPANPFLTWSYVFIPYCTGDLHSGDAERTYGGFVVAPVTWAHRGRANIAAALRLLVPAFPSPRRLVVSGGSAGGFGALLQYEAFRSAWSAGQTFLVDDSGPPLVGEDLRADLRDGWRTSWNLDPLLDQVCPGCRDDFSQIVTDIATRHPSDRIALLSSLQDLTIRTYFGYADRPADFEVALRESVQARFVPTANAKTFLVSGSTHPMFDRPHFFSASGVSLHEWLRQMVDGDAAWQSVGP